MALPFEDPLMIAARPSLRLPSQSPQHPQSANLGRLISHPGPQVPSLSYQRLVATTREYALRPSRAKRI